MSVLRGMASVLAGVGTGLVANKEDAEKKARQDKEDAWRDEMRENQRAEIARANADRQGMRDAGAERTTMQGTVTQAGDNKYLNADPVQAAKMQEMLAAEAEMTGGPAPTQQAGTGITGAMARGHQITTEPVDLKAINGPEARAGRFQAELERQGKPLDAMNMSNAVMENKAKALNLDVAQLKHLNTTYNNKVMSRLNAPGGTIFENAAKLASDVQFGGLEGTVARVEVSADGKTVSIIGSRDGVDAPPMSFPNNATGRMQLSQSFMRVDEATQAAYLRYEAEREQAQAKDAQTQTNSDRDFELRMQQHRQQTLSMRGGGGSPSPTGINMDSIDKTLTGLFSKEDPNTGAKSLNTAGLAAVRQLALRTPAAANGDSTGAALQAYNAYEAAMVKAGGDSAVAMQMLNAAMAPPQAPAPQANPIGAPTTPAAAPVTNMRTDVATPKQALEPKGRVEFQQFQEAVRLGYKPTARGNAIFGAGEVLYINPKTGDRKYASQLFGK